MVWSDPLSEARGLGFKVFDVNKRMGEDFDAIAESMGLTPLQARTVLELTEPKPMRGLAAEMACDASNVTGLADRLERLGLVDRVPGTDRRVKLLSLTPSGAELRGELAARVGAESTLMAKLEPGERAVLERLLDKLLG